MNKVENQKERNEVIYTESRTARDEAIGSANIDFLDKLKSIKYLTDDMVLSIDQIAQYYDASIDSIRTIIKRNRDEFECDGMIVLSGMGLREFKDKIHASSDEPSPIGSNINSLTLLTKSSLLRIGLIMTNNLMATKIRNYLIQAEKLLSDQQRDWIIQREVGMIERKRMTSAIAKYIPNTKHKRFAYPTYTNMLYKILFNKDAKELRIERNVKTNDALRDTFSKEELHNVEEGETIITALIALGFTYKQIEEHLKNKYIKQIQQNN
jgi:hypothetical protein